MPRAVTVRARGTPSHSHTTAKGDNNGNRNTSQGHGDRPSCKHNTPSRYGQNPAASRLVLRRLCHRRHDFADRRRRALRGTRSSRRAEGARRRRRQRQCQPAAARRWCNVVSTDYVPALLERGRARATADGLTIEFKEADAEALPFTDDSFDVVVSTFGVMFTPNQDRAAAELLRVCRSGGRIGLANWTPEGFIGQVFKTLGK